MGGTKGAPKASGLRQAVPLLCVLALALIVRVIWLSQVDTQPVTDFDWYYERALAILRGEGYSVNFVPTAYWPVGYPAFLAALFKVVGPSVFAGKVANTVLTLCVIALTWAIGRSQFEDAKVATVAGVILAIHPAMVAYSGILASEPLYTTLLLLGAWLGTKAVRAPFSGFAFGLATLVRPQAVVVPVIVALAETAKKLVPFKTWVLGLTLTFATLAIVLLPWTIRNYRQFGQLVFVSTNGGDNLWIGNNESATGGYQTPNAPGLKPTMNEAQRDKAASRAALLAIKSDPARVVSLWPAKVRTTFLSGTDAPYWAFQKTKGRMKDPGTGADKPLFKGFRSYSVIATNVMAVLAGLGLGLCLLRRSVPVLGLLMILYCAALSIVFFGNPRFAFPAVPFLALYAGAVLTLWKGFPKASPASQSS